MNSKIFNRVRSSSAELFRMALVVVFGLIAGQSVRAEIVELTITGYWTEKEFKVTDRTVDLYDPANPKFDGRVFGVTPEAGSATFKLRVNTDGALFFAQGSEFTVRGVGAFVLRHDFYGYRDVELVGGSYSFGNALWKSDGILAKLDGPDGQKAALWTDVDITKKDPIRVSFRMFGKADGLTPDLFVGSRTHFSIGRQFLLWEFYAGEEIRSNKYVATAKVVHY